jgi:hypothetical protein
MPVVVASAPTPIPVRAARGGCCACASDVRLAKSTTANNETIHQFETRMGRTLVAACDAPPGKPRAKITRRPSESHLNLGGSARGQLVRPLRQISLQPVDLAGASE